MHFLDWVLLVLSVLIIVVTLLQGGKDGASSSIMGGMSSPHSYASYKERGPEKIMTRITFVLAVLFFFLTIAVRILVDVK